MDDGPGIARLVLAIVAASTLARVVAGATVGLAVDEAYTVGVTRVFQWSWFDHPPLAFWWVHAMQRLGGGAAANLLVRAPFILAMSASIWLLFTLTRRVHGARAGLWAALSFALAPFFLFAAGGWALPDGPLILALLVAAHALVRVLFEAPTGQRAWALWLGAGLALGLAGLSKYQAAFVAFGAAGYLLATPHRAWLARPHPWVAAVLAVAVVSPVLFWNAANGWVSFLFQGGRGAAGGGLRFDQLGQMILGEAAYLIPWTAAAMVVAALAAVRRPGADRLFLAMAVPVILLFTLTPLWGERGLPHWTMPGWLFLFPALGRTLADMVARASPWPRRGAIASLFAVALVFFLGVLQSTTGMLKIFGLVGPTDPTYETIEWTGLGEGLAARGLPAEGMFLVSTRWLEAGRLDHAFAGRAPVLVADADPRGFAFLVDQRSLLGRDALVVGTTRTMAGMEARLAPHFERVERLGTIPVTRLGQPEFALEVLLARGFRQPFPWPYGRKDTP